MYIHRTHSLEFYLENKEIFQENLKVLDSQVNTLEMFNIDVLRSCNYFAS